MDFLICAKKKLRVFSKILMLNMNPNVLKKHKMNSFLRNHSKKNSSKSKMFLFISYQKALNEICNSMIPLYCK